MDEGREVDIGEAEGRGKEELDHHIVGATGGGAREDEVGGDGDGNAQEEEEGLGDHCVSIIGQIDTHLPEAGPEAPELVVSVGEAICVRIPARQQRLGAAAVCRFHDDTSSRH
ncbi:hypothetical protein BHE74_00025958 [Ensete ventricosum]|nr:hypothetical protein BHE74_00025958 [Ensete ventricosum]RZS04295.1 hypothetical protein BHM03_00034608 [Ensete ventricosum]